MSDLNKKYKIKFNSKLVGISIKDGDYFIDLSINDLKAIIKKIEDKEADEILKKWQEDNYGTNKKTGETGKTQWSDKTHKTSENYEDIKFNWSDNSDQDDIFKYFKDFTDKTKFGFNYEFKHEDLYGKTKSKTIIEKECFIILGLKQAECTKEIILTKFRELSKIYHPDKNRNKSEKERNEAETKFKNIVKAKDSCLIYF